jgi:hypothetical protein
LTRSNPGLKIKIPIKSKIDVVKSRQKAKPIADNPLLRMIRLMKIPEVDQQIVAVMTSMIPITLLDSLFRFVSVKNTLTS